MKNSLIFSCFFLFIFIQIQANAINIVTAPDSVSCGTTPITVRTGCTFNGAMSIEVIGNSDGVIMSNLTDVIDGFMTFDLTVNSNTSPNLLLKFTILSTDDPTGCSVLGEIDTFSIKVNCGCTIDMNTNYTDETCLNCQNGSATVDIAGATDPISYQWSNGATTASVEGLAPGAYTVTVTDGNGCSLISTINILPYTCFPFDVNDVVTNLACNGNCDGTINVLGLTNNSTSFTTMWNNGSTSPLQTNLCPGVFTVTVTDSDQCFTIKTYNITTPEILVLSVGSITNATAAEKGKIQFNMSGGTPALLVTLTLSGVVIGSNGSGLFEGLEAGCYMASLIDISGCITTLDSICVSDETLSDNIISKNIFSAYPNPASDVINFNWANTLEEVDLVIFNSTGAIMGRYNKPDKINVSNFTSGLYFISIIGQDKNHTIPINLIH